MDLDQIHKLEGDGYMPPSYEKPKEQLTDPAEPQGQQGDYDLAAAGHPIVCIFTFIFKALGFVVYLFGGLLFSDTLVFIFVILLNSFDFWTVKNVSGRLLVGLRWWSEYNDQGEEVWRYQSYDKEFKANKVDSAFFWTSQTASTLGWAALFLIKSLSLSVFWGILTMSGLALSGTNLYGYYKCNSEYKDKLKNLKNGVMMNMAGGLLNVFRR